MMIPYLMVRDADGGIDGVLWHDDPDVGPVNVQQPPPHGITLVRDMLGFTRNGHEGHWHAYWRDGAVVWEADLPTLRANKNAEINNKREELNTETFPYLGKKIRCRPLDRSDIDGTNGYIALFGEFPDDWAGGWKAEDNSYVAITTLTDWKAFYKAMVDTGNANFRHAQQLKSLLAAAETPEQIAAITWETPIG